MAKKSILGKALSKLKGDSAHYEAFGRFVSGYAAAENTIHQVARALSGMPEAKARLIFSPMRMSDIIDRIRAFMKIDEIDAESRDLIEKCLVQLTHISERRHRLVHRSSLVLDGQLLVTNELTAKSLEAHELDNFEIDELDDMASDCRVIFLLLGEWAQPEPLTPEHQKIHDYARSRPWRYKHVPPKPLNQQTRKAPESRKLRPPSSQGKPE